MRLRVGDERFRGRAIDPFERGSTPDVDRRTLARTIAAVMRAGGGSATVDTGSRRVDVAVEPPVPAPTPVHATLGVVPTGESLQAVLAAAARSRGRSASNDPAIAAMREELASLSVPTVDLDAARRRVANAGGREERLRERAAALRGDLSARRELGAETDSAAAELETATAELAAAETERIAAEQAFQRASEAARAARDARDRRLELEDAIANHEREARRDLACTLYPAFTDALDAIPGGDPGVAGDAPAAYRGDVVAAELAAVRVADFEASVVLARGSERFDDANAAATVLECPVVRL